jgi:hypothetical protein
MNDFDPYDLLMQMNERMLTMERAHNKLAAAFSKSEHELTMALQSLCNLQQAHLKLSQYVHGVNIIQPK